MAKVITELEEFIPGARTPLKRISKVAAESVSDALIKDRPRRSESRTPVYSQDSCESEGCLMQIDAIEKHFVGSRDMEDNGAFVDRSLMRIVEPDLQIRDVQTTTNTKKGKAVLVEALKRRRMRLHSPCMNFISLAVYTNYSFYAPSSSIESLPSLFSAYMRQNETICYAILYELKLYAYFVFNSEEEQR
ncbi:hypothetical protein Cgig2_029011 [Carnegiea gigantea]|uniref:Uncharacterized protein n=1 Tax=Carnegiea gigantea TaxID=171969 RepID=A0A9Q1JW42_9CARY|nr:hypothetical protein Cgig2_029011 [Carnegiea gigantea]